MAKRILVVDPDEGTRLAVRRLAEAIGVSVDEADGFDGLVERVRADGTHVVLLDLDADAAAAFRAADALKENRETSGVQVLALSAHLDSPRTAGATEHAFEDYLGKPVNGKELVPILRFHLDLPHGLNDAHPL